MSVSVATMPVLEASMDAPSLLDVRLLRGEGGPRRKLSPRCQECGRITTEGKPYCPAHVHLCEHAARVLEELARMEREADSGEPPVDGLLAEDVLALLEQCPSSAGKLSRLLPAPASVLEGLLERLEEVGSVERADGTKTTIWRAM